MTDGSAGGVRVGPRTGDAFGACLMACWERGASYAVVLQLQAAAP